MEWSVRVDSNYQPQIFADLLDECRLPYPISESLILRSVRTLEVLTGYTSTFMRSSHNPVKTSLTAKKIEVEVIENVKAEE